MDQLVLASKLESLRRCLARIEAKTPAEASQLMEDADLQDILVLNLTRAVQLCVDIGSHIVSETDMPAPSTMGEVFESMQLKGLLGVETTESMKKAVGFRNVAVHNYEKIDWDIVHSICTNFLDDFQDFARSIDSLS